MSRWSPVGALLFVTLLVVLSVGIVSTGPSSASPQPTPVCPNCGVQFEDAAAAHGYDVSVARSTVDLRVTSDGEARWRTRTTLTASSASNLTPRTAYDIASTRVDDHPLGEASAVEAGVDGRVVEVSYRLSDVATTRTGVVLVDAFYREYDAWWIVNADRFTVHAPDGHRLANDHAADTNATAITYHGSSQDRFDGTSIGSDAFMAFLPEGTGLPDARADIAIATYLLPAALGDVIRTAIVPAVLLTAAVLLYPRLGVADAAPNIDVDQLAATTIGIVATILGLLLALGTVWFGVDVTASVLAAGFGILATALAVRYPDRATLRGIVVAALAGLFAFATSNVLVVTATTQTSLLDAVQATSFAILLAIPAIAILPLGYADATSDTRARYLRLAIVVAPIVLVATRVPYVAGFGAFFLLLVVTAYALTVGVLGVLPYWVGVRIGTAQSRPAT